jgi:hypothetical protein
VSHTRHEAEKVDAFSAPRSLLAKAAAAALRKGMTKSGFYRYCLAKELGYDEAEALVFAEHGGVRRLRESLSNTVEKGIETIGHRVPYAQNLSKTAETSKSGLENTESEKAVGKGSSSKPVSEFHGKKPEAAIEKLKASSPKRGAGGPSGKTCGPA